MLYIHSPSLMKPILVSFVVLFSKAISYLVFFPLNLCLWLEARISSTVHSSLITLSLLSISHNCILFLLLELEAKQYMYCVETQWTVATWIPILIYAHWQRALCWTYVPAKCLLWWFTCSEVFDLHVKCSTKQSHFLHLQKFCWGPLTLDVCSPEITEGLPFPNICEF